MARRSLKASTVGIEKAKRAFQIREWTQEYLASEVGLETRQPIWKFFTGRPIERHSFMEICFQLGLDWQEIAELPTGGAPTEKKLDWDNCQDVDALVEMVRKQRSDKIQAQCATMRLLDISQPIELEDIYVDVNIQNNITSQRWLDIFELQGLFCEEFHCFPWDQVCQERVPAMQAVATYPKLMVLGKPGSGKTTLLQHIATQCNQGKFQRDRIPIFIRLQKFAEHTRETGDFSLLNYINQELADFGIGDQQIQTLLAHGKLLILLDGLDEIPEDDSAEIVKKIRKLSEDYYKNQFIITCRIGTQQCLFDSFTDIEIADFDSSQIEAFVYKWFVSLSRNCTEQALALACQFMQKLQLSENWHIRELGVLPLLLNLLCCVFQDRADFPARQVELYKHGLDLLLNRWDRVRSIKRDNIYPDLSVPHKLKLLSQIAAITFKQERYFFTKSNVRQYIADYLRNLPTVQADEPEVLQLNSEAVLKSFLAHGLLVERARGIYSFSHLTFQEYLTARNIVTRLEPEILKEKLIELVSHVTEPRWRKIFLLTADMLGNAPDLLQLLKQQIDALVGADEQLQQFLIWLNQKSLSVQAPYKTAAIRAFYLTLVLPRDLSIARDLTLSVAIDPRLAGNLATDLKVDLALNRALSLSLALASDATLDRVLALNFALTYDIDIFCDCKFEQSLQQLKKQLPAPNQSRERLKKWWNANGQTWIEKLRSLMLRCRNIRHQWQFSDKQKELLKQYYAANQLLVNCLKVACDITPTVREQISETLLLPITRTSSDAVENNVYLATGNVVKLW
ncbi:NACHT domain-containing protein [Scytonema hofmannii]|uniref:NACHT domain-containing protein n=1 Tax=Scytonema hofmannii TaxID=34078 RepID=UPI000345C684|nr:NACHT domain-containing NTPase [Scytonema hofmannii]